jgi:hypothetical protein
MAERPREDDRVYLASSEHREDLEEILSMSGRLRSIITRLPPSPVMHELLDFHQTLHDKIKHARDSYIMASRGSLDSGMNRNLAPPREGPEHTPPQEH